MKCKNRFYFLGIVACLICSFISTPILAGTYSNTDYTDIDKEIVQSMLKEAKEPGFSFEKGVIISSRENLADKAFVVREPENDGIVKITTIIPFSYLPDGALINSFNYFENISARTVSPTMKFSGKKDVITPKYIIQFL